MPAPREVSELVERFDRNGLYLGRVTSCVSLGETQVGLALLEKLDVIPGTPITLLNPPRSEETKNSHRPRSR